MAATAAAEVRAEVRGTVVDAVTGAPVAGASVYGKDDTPAITDERGTFVLGGAPATITVVTGDHDPAVADVIANRPLVVVLSPRARRDGGELGEVIEIVGEEAAPSPGALRVDRGKLTVIPGARGDVLSGVKNLPGIANNGSLTPLSSGLIIRGSSPESSRILVDGFEVPVLYHFLGVQSVLPTEMLSDLEYLPGAFNTSWGRRPAASSRRRRATRCRRRPAGSRSCRSSTSAASCKGRSASARASRSRRGAR